MASWNGIRRRGFLGAVAALGALGLKACALDNRAGGARFAPERARSRESSSRQAPMR